MTATANPTQYRIRSLKTKTTYARYYDGITLDWGYAGEGEIKFPSMTEAILWAAEHGISDYEVEPCT